MRAVVTRVLSASVTVDGHVVGDLPEPGLLVLLGVTHIDTEEIADRMAAKIHQLRILADDESLATSGAGALVVSQFTLYGDTRKGRRPSWSAAAPGPVAEPLVARTVSTLAGFGTPVATGIFGAMMAVRSVNDGPFTVLLDL